MPLRLDTRAKGFAADFAALLSAKRESEADVDAAVAEILAAVKGRGDAAIIEYTRRFDRLELTPATMRIPAAEIAAAASSCSAETVAALRLAAERIAEITSRFIVNRAALKTRAEEVTGWIERFHEAADAA